MSADRTQPAPAALPRISLRRFLLLGILLPVLGFVIINTVTLYRQALAAADTAYDRTLLASAKAIGELLTVSDSGNPPRLLASLPYSALEAFEADNRSRMVYRVTGFSGEMVSGFHDLPPARPQGRTRSVYAALVDFYDDNYQGEPVRMAVLLQPVSGLGGQGMATIQVAETLQLRRTLAQSLLMQTLWQQLLLVVLIELVVVFVVQRATAPVRLLSAQMLARDEADLSPLPARTAPRELQPLLDATNKVMARLAQVLDLQKRFVRDASHQLRTPLAVLKTQVQSARRGDVDAEQALAEINVTVDRATELANQMLALAKVEQLRHQGDAPVLVWDNIVRAVALDVSPLLAAGSIDFDIETQAAPVRAHEWALRELTRNLLHNAIKPTPAGAPLSVSVSALGDWAVLKVSDSGPGIGPAQRQRLFQPFAAVGAKGGSGLGLAICQEIVQSLGGSIELRNREADGELPGLEAVVRLPLATAITTAATTATGSPA
ncbi:MAG: sensor histidine kinase [Rubrivivax sp.]|nr:sensor histidine kinase [Rubrivivax sp.]